MRLAVLGIAGRTGKHLVEQALARGHIVVGLSRKPATISGVTMLQGDALDSETVKALVKGCDAVVCALSPSSGAPSNQDSRVAATLVDAMKFHAVSRLAVVTGALQGDEEQLGSFYRFLQSQKAIRALVDDRRVMEKTLLESGLEVSVLRPPRLTDGPPSVGGPEQTADARITMMDTCSRSDLAQALLSSVERAHPSRVTFVRSHPRWGRFWRDWIWRCGLAEMVSIALAAATAIGINVLLGEPQTLPVKWATYFLYLLVGAFEGALIGLAQGSLLKRRIPQLRLAAFAALTALPVVLAWGIGMAPSTFFFGQLSNESSAPGMSAGAAVLVGVLGGALGGALIGASQSIVLRRQVKKAGLWVAASACAWAIALPVDLIGATLPDTDTPGLLIVLSAAVFGLLAGLTFSIPTGWVALRLHLRTGLSSTPRGRGWRLRVGAPGH